MIHKYMYLLNNCEFRCCAIVTGQSLCAKRSDFSCATSVLKRAISLWQEKYKKLSDSEQNENIESQVTVEAGKRVDKSKSNWKIIFICNTRT